MTRKDSHSDQEKLWSKSFDEEEFAEVPYSRSAKKKAEKSISPVTKTILIFGILLFVLSTAAYIWWLTEENTLADTNKPEESQNVATQNNSTAKKDSTKAEKSEVEEPSDEKEETSKQSAEETE